MSRFKEIKEQVKTIRKASKTTGDFDYCFCTSSGVCSWCAMKKVLLLTEELIDIAESLERENKGIKVKEKKTYRARSVYEYWH